MKKNTGFRNHRFINTGLLCLMLLIVSNTAVAQQGDSIKRPVHFGGTITATQNGISLIPSFSLGRPAVMFDLNMGGRKLTFEPFLRFGVNGRPWAFIFWWRYKFISTSKFRMSMGAHPSYVFRTITDNSSRTPVAINRADRYAALDFTPALAVSKNTTIGVYYLYSHGLDKTSVQNTHFITLNANFTHIKLLKSFYAKFNPQVYYLNMAGKDGFYATHSFTIAREKFPLSIQTVMNRAFRTEIAGNRFVWNIGLLYNFNKTYVRSP